MLEKKLHSIPWPTLGDGADIAEKISKIIQENRGDAPPDVEDEENLEIDVQSVVEQIIQRPVEYSVSPAVAARLSTEPDYRRVVVVAGMVRASRLWPLSLLIYIPQGIEEITCFSHKEWTVRQRGNKALLKAEGNPFASDEQVTQLLRKIVSMPGVTGNKALTEAEPMAEIQFGTIMRLSCAIDPVVSSRDDVVAAIRLPQAGRWKDLGVYVKEGVITPGVATFLAACIDARLNILIAGGTNTGKTTLLRVLAGRIPSDETVVVIEKGAELNLKAEKEPGVPWVRLVIPLATIPSVSQHSGRREGDGAGITMGDLVSAALRYTPDRIILGEARGSEMAECCTAMTSGHDGSMVTIHANSARQSIDKAVRYVMQHPDFRGNRDAAAELVEEAVEVVVHLRLGRDGSRRVSGILAVEEGGNRHDIYKEGSHGLERKTRSIEDLSRLKDRLDGMFLNNEVPEA